MNDEPDYVFVGPETGIYGRGAHEQKLAVWTRQSLARVLCELHGDLARSTEHGIVFFRIPFGPSQPIFAVAPKTIAMCEHADDVASLTEFMPGIQEQYALPSIVAKTPVPSPQDWCNAVEEAVRRIRNGELEKVVLSRHLVIDVTKECDQIALMHTLRDRFPQAYCFALDGFVGASPELLIARKDARVFSRPLAGTIVRHRDTVIDRANQMALMESEKNRIEHGHLLAMVRETLSPFCATLTASTNPEIMSLANVHHLASRVEGNLKQYTNVLELVAALHPTPAVGGSPTQTALDLIAELEAYDRGPYAGAVGWVDAQGNGEFAVSIRSVLIDGTTLTAFAGSGIVADSDPKLELAETDWKLNAILSALGADEYRTQERS